MPLYDILNEFQKGSSHMAAVVKVIEKSKNPQTTRDGEKFGENKVIKGNYQLTIPMLPEHSDKLESVFVDIDKAPESITTNYQTSFEQNGPTISLPYFSEDFEDGEVIGIITLEDVFEELLQVSSISSNLTPFFTAVCLNSQSTSN